MLYKAITTSLIIFCSCISLAQKFSYVYIQGDKQTPFYVKMEGEMLPRYSKNYCIIPRLAAGTIHIQILFQQNLYPVHDFYIKVPEAGSREFLLTRKGSAFSLYDLQQGFYLEAKDQDGDHFPPKKIMASNPVPVPSKANLLEDQPAVAKTVKPEKTNEPVFLEMELRDKRNTSTPIKENPKKEVIAPSPRPVIPNSDCPQAMEDEAFESLYKELSEKESEPKRFSFLMKKIPGNCFNTVQASILARKLRKEESRYLFLKKIYPRISDQHYFRTLEQLFNIPEWKNQFKNIAEPNP